MKSLLVFCAFLIPFSPCAQDILDSVPFGESGVAQFERVIELKEGKDTLFTKAKLWIARVFENSKSVIQSEDRNDGILICKGYAPYYYYFEWQDKKKTNTSFRKSNTMFIMKIFLKDHKAKIVLTDFVIDDLFINKQFNSEQVPYIRSFTGRPFQNAIASYRGLIQTINAIILTFETYMTKKAENDF